MVDRNLSNISLVNTHYLQYENIRDINNGKIRTPEDLEIIDLYGKMYLIPKFMQNELTLPACFCDLYYSDPFLFALRQKGYVPPNWCKEECPHCKNCHHKDLFSTAWTTARATVYGVHDPVLWIPPKAYNNSFMLLEGNEKSQNLINRILTTFNKSNMLYDENMFGYSYTETKFTDWQLRVFKEFISRKIIILDNGLYDLWKDLIPVIDCIYNNILMTSISDSVKMKDFKSKIETFYKSYNAKDFRKWYGKIMFLMYDHKIPTNISNPLLNLHKIISNMYKNRNNPSDSKNFMFGKTNAGQGQNFSYFIDQSDTIRDNIKNAGKFILRSGFQHIEKFWNYMFPDYDDYAILKSPDSRSYFNYYFRYTKGAYAKYVMIQKDFRPAFYSLGKFCKEIIDLPTIRPQKILIVAFQQGIKELQQKYFPPLQYPNLSYEYWYNLEGKNTYLNCTGVILFGSAGKPTKIDKILSSMYNIPLKYVKNYSINGEMSQGMLRIRPNMFPNLKWCIGLTKVLPNGIINYINFNRADDIVLIPYLKEKKQVTANEILSEIYNNKISLRTLQKKLKELVDSKLLKSYRKDNFSPYTYQLVKDF